MSEVGGSPPEPPKERYATTSNSTAPAAGQIWRPTKAGAKAKERLVVRVCPDRLGNPGVDYAEADGERSWITLSAWNVWVRRHAAQMEEPKFAGSAEQLAKLTRRGSRG